MHPNLVLVAAVTVTVIRGFGPGVAWAFVAGLTANLLTREPLGSIPLGLLLVVAAVSGGARLFGRLAWAYPVAAVAIGSVVVDAISLGVLLMVAGSVLVFDALAIYFGQDSRSLADDGWARPWSSGGASGTEG